MNPQLTCSQRQWLHSSVGRASHRYREVTGLNPVEVLIFFFQASLRNCLNCVHCDDHFFIFILFPQFIYDLFHIECFHSRGRHLCKFIGTKGSVCMRKVLNSQRIGLGHQHCRRFIVLGHQYGRRDVM